MIYSARSWFRAASATPPRHPPPTERLCSNHVSQTLYSARLSLSLLSFRSEQRPAESRLHQAAWQHRLPCGGGGAQQGGGVQLRSPGNPSAHLPVSPAALFHPFTPRLHCPVLLFSPRRNVVATPLTCKCCFPTKDISNFRKNKCCSVRNEWRHHI